MKNLGETISDESLMAPKVNAKTLRQKDQIWTILWKAYSTDEAISCVNQRAGENLSGKPTEAY
jgi:hypothetical protein